MFCVFDVAKVGKVLEKCKCGLFKLIVYITFLFTPHILRYACIYEVIEIPFSKRLL